MKILRTETGDGLRLSGLLFESPQQTNKIIIHVHGMAGDPYSNAFLGAMFDGYAKSGVSFLSVELRGTHSMTGFNTVQGGVRVVGNALEVFEDCVLDIRAWVAEVQKLGFKEIWLQGHSLGCSKVVFYVATQNSPLVSGLILLSPSDMLGWNLSPKNIGSHKLLLEESSNLAQSGLGAKILNNLLDGEYPISARTYLSLFGETAKDAIFNFGNPELGYEALAGVSVPVIAFTGTKDNGVICSSDPYAAMQILENQFTHSGRKKTIVFDGAKHDFDGFGDQIVREVIDFVA